MKQLCIATITGTLVLFGSAALSAQVSTESESAGPWKPWGNEGRNAPIPKTFVAGITSATADMNEIIQYGLSLPDPPLVWLPEGFQQTERRAWSERTRQLLAEEIAKPTPRLSNGHPDLNGAWVGCGRNGCVRPEPGAERRRGNPPPRPPVSTLPPEQRPEPTPEQKLAAISFAAWQRPRNQPVYKDSVDQARQHELWYRNIFADTAYKCVLVGVPRIFAPAYVVQTDKELTFVYASKSDANTWRVIPFGGEFDPNKPPSPYGQSIARWEGDTLVVEVRNLDPDGWFGEYGLFHSPNMKVTERYRRVGDIMVHQATVEDDLLAQPFVSTARYNITSDSLPTESEPCVPSEIDNVRTELFPVPFHPEGN